MKKIFATLLWLVLGIILLNSCKSSQRVQTSEQPTAVVLEQPPTESTPETPTNQTDSLLHSKTDSLSVLTNKSGWVLVDTDDATLSGVTTSMALTADGLIRVIQIRDSLEQHIIGTWQLNEAAQNLKTTYTAVKSYPLGKGSNEANLLRKDELSATTNNKIMVFTKNQMIIVSPEGKTYVLQRQ